MSPDKWPANASVRNFLHKKEKFTMLCRPVEVTADSVLCLCGLNKSFSELKQVEEIKMTNAVYVKGKSKPVDNNQIKGYISAIFSNLDNENNIDSSTIFISEDESEY
nr:unnamed protein product [Callosobruchus analis]